jgi:hypothetical protein
MSKTADIFNVVALGLSTTSVWALLIAMLRSPKIRSNAFNLYLIFCFASDAFYFLSMLLINLVSLVTASGDDDRLVNLVQQHQQQQQQPNHGGEDGGSETTTISLHLWNELYWLCASLWLAFIVFIQIYKLLVANKQTRRYQSPPLKRVIMESAMVHLSSIILATIGAAVVAIKFHYMFSALLITVLILGGIPMILISSMCFGVWRNKLLPLKNTRYRTLTVFFARLLASTYLMAVLVAMKVSFLVWDVSKNFAVFVLVMFKLFGFFQVCLALSSEDLRNAFVEMFCCRKPRERSIGKRSMFSTRRLSTTTTREAISTRDEVVEKKAEDAVASRPVDDDENMVQPSRHVHVREATEEAVTNKHEEGIINNVVDSV